MLKLLIKFLEINDFSKNDLSKLVLNLKFH